MLTAGHFELLDIAPLGIQFDMSNFSFNALHAGSFGALTQVLSITRRIKVVGVVNVGVFR